MSTPRQQMRTATLLRGLYYYDRRLVARIKRVRKAGKSAASLAMERADLVEIANELLATAPDNKDFNLYRKYFAPYRG